MRKPRLGSSGGSSIVTFAVMAVLAIAVVSQAAADGGPIGQWAMGGQNVQNTRSQSQNALGVGNAGQLAVKWTATMGGDVSSTPAVNNGAVYVTDWGQLDPSSGYTNSSGGSLTKLDAQTGALIWKRRLDSYANEPAGAVSRTSPAVVDNVVYIGDQNGANVLAIDAKTGNLIWNSGPINPGPFAIDTQSPIVSNGVVYVGAASSEEGVAAADGYPCCFARGSMSAIDAATGHILWTKYMIPAGTGYSGAGVWAGTAALDPKSGTIYVGTGNNYSEPASVRTCEAAHPTDPAACIDPNDHIDSIVALNTANGAIKWATGVQGYDDWNVSCIQGGGTNCPKPTGPDYDFGSGPNLMTVKINGKMTQVVGEGQKSGAFWLMDATTGKILWGKQVGPGSTLGGIEWGTAADNGRIYVSVDNFNGLFGSQWTLPDGSKTTAGVYAALDAATGKILWEEPDPSGSPVDIGPVSVSNGVMYVGSMSGQMYALDASNGHVLWHFQGAGSSNAGPAIGSDGTLYWGNGYSHFGLGSPSNTFYAFSVGGK